MKPTLFRKALLCFGAVALLSANLFAAGKELKIYCWSEYVPDSVIKEFEKETGIKVSVENYASNEEMVAKLTAGGGAYDLIQPSEYMIEALAKENLLLPLEKKNIPNIKNLAPEFVGLAFDPENKYSVPWMSGTVGIAVNTEKVKDPIRSFKDVFQDKYKKRIVVLDDAREMVSWALASQGMDINTINDGVLEKVKPTLQKWLPLVKVYDSDSPKTSFLNGEVDLGVIWSGEGALLFNEDKKFQWVLPAGETHRFIDNLAIPKTAKNKENAEKFIDFILRPEISKLISDEFPYTNPNAEARKLLTPEQLANSASYPKPEEVKQLKMFRDIGNQASAVDEMVTEIRAE